MPFPYLIYRGDILKVDLERISGRIFKTNRILLDVSLYGSVPVDCSRNSARSGMPDLDPTFEIGPSLEIRLLENKQEHYKFSATLPVRAIFAVNSSSLYREGFVFSPRLNFEKDDIIPKNSYYYSVDPAFATSSRTAYSASSGYSGSRITVGLNKGYKQLIFNAFVSLDFLQGAVFEDSPLVKTRYSVMWGFAVSWIFLKSEKLVPADR